MKRFTIKVRITLLCTILAAAVALLALTVVLANEQRMATAYFRDTLVSTVQLALDELRVENGELEIDRNLDDLPNVRVAVYSEYGDLIYGQQRFELPFEAETLREAQGRRNTCWMVWDTLLQFEDYDDVWLRCYISSDAVENMRGVHLEMLLILFPALILLAALGGWGVARHALKPVNHMISTAEGIADGADLKKRIGMTGANDELYRTARVFDDMLERLDESFERERRFTSDVSHELRTPVAAIMMQSELGLSETADENERRACLEEIHGRSRHLSTLIQRLLGLSRLDARKALGDVQDVDLSMLAEVVSETMEERAGEAGVHIGAQVCEDAWIRGDQTMLTQAALNLAENAIRHGKGSFVKLSVERIGKECIFRVEDDGCGIPPEEQARIFDRFYQADTSRHDEGFGLGLPLVQRIVELHGGRMELRSTPGKGSCFEMIFPAGEEEMNA